MDAIIQQGEDNSTAENARQTMKVGDWMAVGLPQDTAPLRCYVGKVQAVDGHGVRLTLVAWITGTATNDDFFVAWTNLESALIATPDHDTSDCGQEVSQWQEAMQKQEEPP